MPVTRASIHALFLTVGSTSQGATEARVGSIAIICSDISGAIVQSWKLSLSVTCARQSVTTRTVEMVCWWRDCAARPPCLMDLLA